MIDKSTIEQLKVAHPGEKLHMLTAKGITVVVKPPARPVWHRFKTEVTDDRKRMQAIEQLVRDCLVYPSLQEFEAQLEKTPAVAAVFAGELGEIAGVTDSVEKKEL